MFTVRDEACVRDWGRLGGSRLWKINFKKPALPLLRPELQPLHFNVSCSLHYLWCFTPQNHGLPPSTSPSLSLIPIVTTSPGSILPSACVCVCKKETAACGMVSVPAGIWRVTTSRKFNNKRSLNLHSSTRPIGRSYFSELSLWSFIYKFVQR